MLLESMVAAEEREEADGGGDAEMAELGSGRRRKCSPLALAAQVRSVANRLPASAVVEQRTKVHSLSLSLSLSLSHTHTPLS
jgi:hypothetical protein